MSESPSEALLCDEAGKALAEGDLHKAADLCKQLLVGYPSSARGYYLTSSLFQATGNYKKAVDYSAIATGLDSCVVQYHLQQGQMLYLLKEYDEALAAFEKATELSDKAPEACRWVGKCMVALERFADAKEWFAVARGTETSTELLIAEAECDMQAGDNEAAERLLAQCINEDPKSARAHYVLAMIAITTMEFDRAEALLRKALNLDIRFTHAHFYLALLLGESGDKQGAADRLLQALQIEPTHMPSLLILGGIFMECGDIAAAEKAFIHALSLAPEHLLVWYSMLELLHECDRGREGLARLSDAIASRTDISVLKHLRALFSGDVPPMAPRDFIAAFYDAFIDIFEPWVIAGSDAPHVAQLVKELRKLPQLEGKKHVSLLDLGCGTGIFARKFSDVAAICVGVDISPGMVKIARRSKYYDVLYDLDITDYVLGSETVFDVVVCVGALRWMGNLQPFFHAVRGVMHKETVLAFMLDKEHSTLAYSVANHGRYTHHQSYVFDVAAAEGLQMLLHKEWVWEPPDGDKVEDGKITRHLFFFKKTTIH
jgi:predicted TPR repeat methyltransferase